MGRCWRSLGPLCEYNLHPEFPANEMETTEANLEIKVTQLDMAVDKTNAVLQGGKNEAIERHLSSLKYISSEINRMRLNLEATKLAEKEMTAIEEWNTKLEKADGKVATARKWLDDQKREESHVQEQKLYFEKNCTKPN